MNPIHLAIVTLAYPEVFMAALRSSNDGLDGKLKPEELDSIDMSLAWNRVKLSLVLCLYQIVTCLSMVFLVTSPLKMVCGRERPTHLPHKNRWCNMREREHGKSMPSGDAAACAFLMAIYLYMYGSVWPLAVVLPLTCLGRVYVYCHWFGDTLIGAVIGYFYCQLFFTPAQFGYLASPLFKAAF